MEQKTPTPQKKVSKKILLVVAAILLVGSSIAGWLLISHYFKQSEPKDLSSTSGKLTINQVHKGMVLRNNSSVSGSVEPQGNAQVFYAITTGNEMLSGGNILTNSDYTFSRNMEFSADKFKGKPGILTVYLQDQQGKRIDSVSVDVVLE